MKEGGREGRKEEEKKEPCFSNDYVEIKKKIKALRMQSKMLTLLVPRELITDDFLLFFLCASQQLQNL